MSGKQTQREVQKSGGAGDKSVSGGEAVEEGGLAVDTFSNEHVRMVMEEVKAVRRGVAASDTLTIDEVRALRRSAIGLHGSVVLDPSTRKEMYDCFLRFTAMVRESQGRAPIQADGKLPQT